MDSASQLLESRALFENFNKATYANNEQYNNNVQDGVR